MNRSKSTFRSEFAIIPRPARVVAIIVFGLVQIGFQWVIPHFAQPKDLPAMPWWILITLALSVVLTIIVLMIGYVNADSKRRGMNSLLWTLLVIFVPKALGFIAYFLLRKPLLIPCPKCGTSVGSDFRYCPKCGNGVTPMCSHCGRPIQYDSTFCPYCGKTVGATLQA